MGMGFMMMGLILCLFIAGACLYWKGTLSKTPMQSPEAQLKKVKMYWMRVFQNPETDDLAKGLGINSGITYQIIRYIFLIIWLCVMIYRKYGMGFDVTMQILLWMVTFFISSPRRSFFGRESPFLFIVTQIQKKNRNKLNLEIYRCMSQLKNLAVAKANSNYSANFIIRELAEYTLYTKPIFNRMLGFWYEGRYEMAAKYFSDTIGTEDAKALAGLLLKIDYLKPIEFISQLELYQSDIKERRKTAAQKAKENRSNLIYGMVIVSGVCILLNFLVVSIAIDAFEYYKSFVF